MVSPQRKRGLGKPLSHRFPHRFEVGPFLKDGETIWWLENITAVFPYVKDHPSINTWSASYGALWEDMAGKLRALFLSSSFPVCHTFFLKEGRWINRSLLIFFQILFNPNSIYCSPSQLPGILATSFRQALHKSPLFLCPPDYRRQYLFPNQKAGNP